MDESFLHFVWKYQRFHTKNLKTYDEQRIIIFNPGNHNHDSGPDFEEARIKINELEWNGSVEIHIKSSDWTRHNHSENKAYANVILHVVWEYDKDLIIDGEQIPTLELKNLIQPRLIKEYSRHIKEANPIACASQNSPKLDMPYLTMIDRLFVERLERKAEEILKSLEKTQNSWDDVCYRMLLRNFGFATNKSVFVQLSEQLPYSILKKNLSNPIKTEALFFGQAGFLVDPVDEHQAKLRNEFDYLSSKYRLPEHLQRHEWKFGRMRPANFPTLRIAQISSLLFERPRIFTELIDSEQIDVFSLLTFDLPSYWERHYDFGKARKPQKNAIGNKSIENIAINTIAPLLAAYSLFINDQSFMDRAIDLLEKIEAEKNRITKKWVSIGRSPKNAFESQAQIQLFNQYCKKRRCLSCSVGVTLLSK